MRDIRDLFDVFIETFELLFDFFVWKRRRCTWLTICNPYI